MACLRGGTGGERGAVDGFVGSQGVKIGSNVPESSHNKMFRSIGRWRSVIPHCRFDIVLIADDALTSL
ncbi:MAG: hypothetical protein AB8G99_07695 [Planctomycetaceae bacterium]